MGQIQSTPGAAMPYNVDPKRFSVQKFECCVNDGDQTTTGANLRPVSSTVLISAEYDRSKQSLVASRADQRPLTFVQDPESGHVVLQLPYQPSLSLRFCLSIALIPGNEQHRLVFAHAASAAELQHSIETRQVGNWTEVGTWTEPRHPVIEKLDFLFVWDAQEDRLGGQPIHFAFFFDGYQPTLATGAAVWVSERPTNELAMLYEPTQTTQLQTPIMQTPLTGATTIPAATGSPGAGTNPPASTSPKAGSGGFNPASSQAPARSVSSSRHKPDNMPYGMPLPSSEMPLAMRPGPEHVFLTEDGPHFRSALVNMERRVSSLRARVKQILKRSLMSRERLEALIEADQWLASGIQEAARHECPSFKPVADWFSRNSEGGLSSIQRQRKVSLNELTTRLIEPLQRFYEYDIKGFEQRKREFEEESNQFYSWTSRYLANRKEGKRGRAGETSDVKFSIKKRAFDVARLDYFNYLNDLTIGLKQQILVQLMALAAQSLTDSHIALGSEMSSRTQPRVDAVVEDIKKAAREWENYRLENLQFRKNLAEDFANEAEEAAKSNIDRQGSPDFPTSAPVSHMPPKNYKEGLLWASSRPGAHQDSQGPNKQSLQNAKWHKYWVVLDGNSLREYTNWKQSMVDLHNEPINLLVAGVREARSKDRRFCFEVVTPQYKRVYQATCEEDVRAWIAAINKSISTLLEASDDQPASPMGREIESDSLLSPTTLGAANIIQALSGNNGSNNNQGYGNNAGPHAGSINSSNHSISNVNAIPTPTINSTMKSGNIPSAAHSAYPSGSPVSIGNTITRVNSRRVSGEIDSGSHSASEDKLDKLTSKLSIKGPGANQHSDRPRVPPINTAVSSTASKPVPALVPMNSPPITFDPSQEDLIRAVQREPSNRVCAECQSTKNVEWVSINLLVVICIECSGAHRSLGSHISKVRSLTLDTGAFTPSLNAALLAVSNEVIKNIWEAKLPQSRRILADATSKARKKYVTEKYVEKQYIEELEKPNSVLRRAIKDQNIPLICAALASRANPNGVSDADEPMLIHALRSAGPLDTTFPSAEVLIKNGATVPPLGVYTGLSAAAQEYLASKQSV